MKKSYCIIAASAALAAVLSYQVDAQNSVQDERLADHNTAKALHQLPKLSRFEKASKVIGAEVKNDQNQRLGKVKDLAVDLENGRIVEVILAAGGHLGIGEEIVAVPPRLFRLDEANKILRLDTTEEKLKAAPRFDLSKWEMAVENSNVRTVYQHYGAEIYFDADHADSKEAQVPRLGYVTRASTLMGAPARNLQEQKLGKVENLVLDLPAGRIAEVIIETGGFLGLGDTYSVVPPNSLHFDAEHKTVRLDSSKESLLLAPHFTANEWENIYEPGYAIGVYRFYHIEPYFPTNDVDNTAQNIRDRANTTLTPLDQGNSPADRSLTTQIRKEIMATEGFSVNARNVKIITINGRVTLRGPVNSQHEKELLGDIASRIAIPGNVDNQLEVKAVPAKAGTGSEN